MFNHGVATVSRIDKIIGLFCRILSLLYGSFAKETYNLIDPTNQSHPIRKTPAHMSRASFACATPKYLGIPHSANAYVCMYVCICVDIMLPGVIECMLMLRRKKIVLLVTHIQTRKHTLTNTQTHKHTHIYVCSRKIDSPVQNEARTHSLAISHTIHIHMYT